MSEGFSDKDWRLLVRTIEKGKCILLLGADAATSAADAEGRPLAQQLAEVLAAGLDEGAEIPARDNLPAIAQTFATAHGRNRLQLEVEDFYSGYAGRTTPLHDLATVPFSVYINTAPDAALTNALRAAGRDPQIEYCDFTTARRFKLDDPSPDRPWVFDLYGSLTDTDALVLTERDLLDYLAAAVRGAPPLPASLIDRLRDQETSLLFISFGFRRWYLRILLHVLRANGQPKDPSLALENNAFFSHPESPSTLVFFRHEHRIRFEKLSCCGFATELAQRFPAQVQGPTAPAPPAEAAKEAVAPVIFLSYASEDHVAVEALSERRQARGLRFWLDRQHLRGGDRWRTLIPDVIKDQVDYVVVLQTPNLAVRVESYVYYEIEEAWSRQKTFAPGLRFLIPALLEPGARIQSLSDLHWVDVTTDQGLENLITTIDEDWQRRRERAGQTG